MGSFLPVECQEAKFSQFYIFDNTESVDDRCKLFPNIRKGLMTKIEDCLRQNHKLIQIYKQIGQEVMKSPNYQMAIRDDVLNVDIRVFNQAAPNQVAAIVPNESLKAPRDIIVQQRDNKLQRITHHHSSCLALCYPLLYIRGETATQRSAFSWTRTAGRKS